MTSLKYITFLLLSALALGNARAETVDLTDGLFTEIELAMAGGTPLVVPRVFAETAGGVVFTFTATNNLVGVPRFNDLTSTGLGIQLGGGGGSVIEFTLATSADVTLDSYSTVSSGFFIGMPPPTFNISGGSIVSTGNALTEDIAAIVFAGAPLLFEAGTIYTFGIENTGAAVQAFLGGIEFTVVPLPAPALLLASGVFGLLAHRRKRG